MEKKEMQKLQKIQKEAEKLGLSIPNLIEYIAAVENVTEEEIESKINSIYRFIEVSPENKTVYVVVNKSGDKFRHYGSAYAFDGDTEPDLKEYVKGQPIERIYGVPKYMNMSCQEMINWMADRVYRDLLEEEAISGELVVLPNVYHANKLKRKNDIVIEGFIPKGCPFIRVKESWSGYSAEIIASVFVPKRIVEDTNPDGFETPQYEDDKPETLRKPSDMDALSALKKDNENQIERNKPENKWDAKFNIPEVIKHLHNHDWWRTGENAFEVKFEFSEKHNADVYTIEPLAVDLTGINTVRIAINRPDTTEGEVMFYLKNFFKKLANNPNADKEYSEKILNLLTDFKK